MGSFRYGTPEKRSWRKDVSIQLHSLEKEIWNIVDQVIDNPYEYLSYVRVTEIRPNNKVLLQFVITGVNLNKTIKSTLFDNEEAINLHCQKVFYLQVNENPRWSCHANVGRGYVEGRVKK